MLDKVARIEHLQTLLVARATGSSYSEEPGLAELEFRTLRQELLDDPELRPHIPAFLESARSLDQFWAYIKKLSPQYQPRREHLWDVFGRLIEIAEGRSNPPVDADLEMALAGFDRGRVHAIWQRALNRLRTEPDAALTSARQLLETTCKLILDRQNRGYTDKTDLPALWDMAASVVDVAPSQQTEELFRTTLGSCKTVVTNVGAIRNKLADAHGKGEQFALPDETHARLVVNLAGSMTMFLVELYVAKFGAV